MIKKWDIIKNNIKIIGKIIENGKNYKEYLFFNS